ncbi:SAM-dependent methyltransferase [Nocardia sp. NPDC057440]|uniref:SAM-dependent methyltransferase n=1 Tax=Nocardia sp. NPDC057440 TaxID=3346134 RepID=UPI00366EEB96
MAAQGIRQLLDIGTGFPAPSDVHEIARSVIPEASVTYVDSDRAALARGRVHHHSTPS